MLKLKLTNGLYNVYARKLNISDSIYKIFERNAVMVLMYFSPYAFAFLFIFKVSLWFRLNLHCSNYKGKRRIQGLLFCDKLIVFFEKDIFTIFLLYNRKTENNLSSHLIIANVLVT